MSRRSTPCSRDRDKTVTASNTVRAVRTALILLLVSLLLPLAGLAFSRRLEGMEWKEINVRTNTTEETISDLRKRETHWIFLSKSK